MLNLLANNGVGFLKAILETVQPSVGQHGLGRTAKCACTVACLLVLDVQNVVLGYLHGGKVTNVAAVQDRVV